MVKLENLLRSNPIAEGETAEVYRIEKGKVLKLYKEEMYDANRFGFEFKAQSILIR